MHRLLSLYSQRQTPIEIIYLAKDGQISQRKISVLQIDGRTVVAFCHLRNTKRTFLLENILSFVPLKNKSNYISL
ncbi:MAG: hypothetical protein ACQEV7_11480 [Bacillota bacterium]